MKLFPIYLLPPVSYFSKIKREKAIILFDEEIYRKQSPRNHFEILHSQGKLKLTMPVIKPWRGKKMTEIKIDNSQSFLDNHWKSIKSAYGKAPFFHDYGFLFEQYLSNVPDSLLELNLNLLKLCMRILQIKTDLKLSSSLTISEKNSELYLNQFAQSRGFDEYFCNAKDVLSYHQLFGSDFVEGLSIIDLLFNHGPESGAYLKS